MKADAGSKAVTALAAAGTLAALTAITVGLTAAFISSETRDLVLMALFLPAAGAASLAAALGLPRIYRGGLLGGIRGRLLAAVLLAAGLIFVNVGLMAILMFLSSHDLKLLALLLLFSLGIAAFFALVVARSFQSTLAALVATVRQMGEGDFGARLHLSTGDELEEVARAVNAMAEQLEVSRAGQREMEDARRHLIAAVSHDLRTPLATMRAMIESINDGVVTDSESIQRYHRTMQAEIGYLSRLIDDLFELSQIDSGLLLLKLETANIADLVSDTLEALRPQAEERRLSLEGEVDGGLPDVVMDTPRMQRVLYNLVQNALRHTPPDGSICIRAVDAGAAVAVSVQDTGEGVDAEEAPRIFERFYRGNRARRRDAAGSGLGLTIARGIVELHGGRISVESERGKGATFVFTVPKA